MDVITNGKAQVLKPGTTVGGLLRSLGLDPRFVIVEHNGEALERSRYPELELADGDRLELVKAVAGG